MKMKTIVVLAFAVGCGLIAMMGVQQMIAKQSNGEEISVKVLVATVDIPPGVLLSESNCTFEDYPSSAVPADAVRTKEDYMDRGLRVPVDKGDIIRSVKLGTRGEIAASASIPKGMRTFTFKVDDTKTHSGLLQPGDRVDLLLTFEYRSAVGGIVTRTDTLLEYIEVFASDEFRNLEVGESREIKAKNLTLLVTPEQANLLQLANTKGELSPIMRNKDDKELVNAGEVNENMLALLTTGKYQQAPKQIEESTPAEALKDSLENGFSQEVVKTEPVVEEIAEKPPTWTMNIYAGEEVMSHEFLLEQTDTQKTGEAELPGEPAKDSSAQTQPQSLQGLFKSFF